MSNFKLVKTAAALALGASVVTSAVATTDASAASKYKIKSGKLVYAKSGKVVKGYVTYKSTVYKNGSKLTGLKGKTYYKAGKKATGTYKGAYYVKGVKKVTTGTYNKAYYVKGVKKVSTGLYAKKYYKDGKLATGTYKGAYYVKGIKKVTTGTYAGSYYVKGVKIVSTGLYQDRLYQAGKLSKGYATYKSILYKDSYQNEGLALFEGKLYDGPVLNKGFEVFEGKLYNGPVLATGFVKHDEKFYNNGELANGEFDGVEYKDGVVVKYEVTDVKAINASELQVTFSQDVDFESATNISNYQLKVNDENGYRKITNISLNGKTAILRLDQANTFQSGDKYVVQTNNDIKTTKGKKLEKFVSSEISFDQSEAPKLVDISKVGSKLKITFDRPVDSKTTTDVTLVKIDGIALSSRDLVPYSTNDELAGKYTYTVDIDSDVLTTAKTVGKHEVIIYDVKDTAKAYAKTASVLSGSYEVTNAVTAPEVTGIEAVNANRIFVYTNVEVSLNSDAKVVVTKGNYEFEQEDTSSRYDDNIAAKSNKVDAYPGVLNGKPGVWVTISDAASTVENPLYKGTETSATVNVTLENFTADGLIGKKATQTVTLNKNNTKPSINASKNTIDDGKLKVVFNNNLGQLANPTSALTALAADDIVVRNKDGVIVSTSGATVFNSSTTGEATVTINGLAKVTEAPYTVEFKKETFRNLEVDNKVSTYLVNSLKNDVLTTTVGSNTANFQYSSFAFKPTAEANESAVVTGSAAVTGAYYVDKTKSTITFNYGKEMSDNAREVANYTLDGKALPTGSKVDFIEGKNVVRITLPEGSLANTTKYKLAISTNVTTKDGSKIVSSLQTKAPVEKVIELKDTVKPELASAVYYSGVETVQPGTTTNRLEVTFNEKLASAITLGQAANDFKVVVNGSEVKVSKVERVTSGENSDRKLVLVLNQQVNLAQAATVTIVDEDAQVGGDKTMAITDVEGNKAKAGSTTTASNYKYNGSYASEVEQLAAAKTALATSITAAQTAKAGKTEGEAVGNQIVGSGSTLTTAITAAKSVHDNTESTLQQLQNAKTTLDAAVVAYNAAKVTAITDLANVSITGTASDSTNVVTLANGESLEVSSADTEKATVEVETLNKVKVTGVAAGTSVITVKVKKDGKVIKVGTFTATVTVTP